MKALKEKLYQTHQIDPITADKALYYLKTKEHALLAQAFALSTNGPRTEEQQAAYVRFVNIAKILDPSSLTLIVGRSGSGKTTLEAKLSKKYNLQPLVSYTTRAQRNPNENNHIFITPEEYANNPRYASENQVAYTNINGIHYFALKEQIDTAQLYVIDPKGIYDLISRRPESKFYLIYLDVKPEVLEKQLSNRRKKSVETDQSQKQRLNAEKQQFDAFSEKLPQLIKDKKLTIIDHRLL